MAPIRVGLLGLSVSSATSWLARAHLQYLKASPKYTVVAVCNSSVSSAELAVKTFELPASTKVYGDPEDLAADPDVDLVVCGTRVDKHAQTINPALRKGKDVFCEWPLGSNLVQAEESLRLAEESGARTMVGLQGRVSPLITKLVEVIKEGRIGEVLSSSWAGCAGNGGDTEPTAISYFTERKIGGNIATIALGHSTDYVRYALGEFEAFNSLLAVQRKTANIIDRATNTVVEKDKPKDTFDHVLIQAQLQSASAIKPVLSYNLRGGKPFPSSNKNFLWRVYGTKGEIEMSSSMMMVSVGSADLEMLIYENGKDGPEKVDLRFGEDVADLEMPGRNIGKLYERFAEGKGYPTFQDAVKTHRFIDEAEKRYDNGKQVSKSEYLQG